MKTALITGGSKRIGFAIAQHLAMNGYDIAIHGYSDIERGASAAETIRKTGQRAFFFDADLSQMQGVNSLIDRTNQKLGIISLLVNNASLFEPDEMGQLNAHLWERHFAINLRAPVFLAERFAMQLEAPERGSIINILDQRVLKPTPHFISYSLTKSALLSATITMAQALAPRIRVNAVGPGPTLRNIRQSEEDFERQSAAVLLGKGPDAQDIAKAVLYLAEAKSVTGQLLCVDGGQHLAWETPDIKDIRE